MRRDMDLIRDLLLRLESLPMQPGDIFRYDLGDAEITFEGRTDDEVGIHLTMLCRAGFIDSGTDDRADLGAAWQFAGLSWAGQDFLESVREPEVWTETKSRAGKIGGWTVGILTDLAKGYLKAEAAKHGFPMG